MKTKLFTFLLAGLAFVSCKNEKSVDELPVEKKKPVVSQVRLELDMIIPADDIFQVYYTEDGTANCSEENSVKVNVKGSPNSQKLIFEFPENKKINYLRIDIGENPNQGTLKVEHCFYTYFGKTLVLKGNEFFQYWSPTEHFTVDATTSSLTPNKNRKDNDAILYALDSLKPALTKLLF